jgi:Ca2+-binding RTX toxin-like protein
MASITFSNTALAFNPGLEDVLSATSSILTHTVAVFELTNASLGPFAGYRFHFTSAANDFIYDSNNAPLGGTISGLTILGSGGAPTIASVTLGAAGFSNADLATFWSLLRGGEPLSALDTLFGNADTITGSNGADHLTSFGATATQDTLSGGLGDDILWARYTGARLIGGGDDDTIRIDNTSGLSTSYEVAGSAAGGAGGPGETNTLEIRGDNIFFSSVYDIDALRFADRGAGGWKVANFDASKIGAGLLSTTLAVRGSTPNENDQINIVAHAAVALHFDLSHWTFANWTTASGHVSIAANAAVLADTILGTTVGDTILGYAGNDTLDGGRANDLLDGGAGNDMLFSRLGEGSIVNVGADTLIGGGGIDFAFIDRSDKLMAFSFDLTDPAEQTVLADFTAFTGIEQIEFRSGAWNDSLTGGALNDLISGGAGRDVIAGNGGNDTLDGGDGVDVLDGGLGNDILSGGIGADTLEGDAGNDTLNGGAGIDIVGGGAGNDILNGGDSADILDGDVGDDVLSGGASADNLDGGAGNDRLNGDAGIDILAGGDGNDTLAGGDSNDTLDGDAGNDVLSGGAGGDSLTGGAGIDFFVFATPLSVAGVDTIEDFSVPSDTIRLENAVLLALGPRHRATGCSAVLQGRCRP